MKIQIPDPYTPRRGDPVVPGNVYTHKGGKPYFRLVLAVVTRVYDKPWNNVVAIHVDGTGAIVGCSMNPERYLSEHNDLVGKVEGELPTIKFNFLKETD